MFYSLLLTHLWWHGCKYDCTLKDVYEVSIIAPKKYIVFKVKEESITLSKFVC